MKGLDGCVENGQVAPHVDHINSEDQAELKTIGTTGILCLLVLDAQLGWPNDTSVGAVTM